MFRCAPVILCVVGGCKSAASQPTTTVPEPTLPAAWVDDTVVPELDVPADVLRALPEVEDSLPALPDRALLVVVRDDVIGIDGTTVAALAEASPRPVAVLAPASSQSDVIVAVLRAARTSGAPSIGLVLRTAENEARWLEVEVAPLADDMPSVSFVAGNVVVSPRKDSHKSFRMDDSSLGEMAWEAGARIDAPSKVAVRIKDQVSAQILVTVLSSLRGPYCGETCETHTLVFAERP